MKPSKALTIKKHEAQLRVYGEGFYNSFNYFEPIHPKVMNTLQFKQ